MDETFDVEGVSRRNLLLGLGAAGGAVAALGGLGGLGGLAGAAPLTASALGAPIPGATYLNLDAFAFLDEPGGRFYQNLTGTQRTGPTVGRVWAPLPIPAGSRIVQISACYQGSPIIEISRRAWPDGSAAADPTPVFQQTFPDGPGGPNTFTAPADVTLDANASYTVSAFLSIVPTSGSILGVSIGYLGGFVPFTGSKPRVIDTRDTGQRLGADEELTVATGLPGRAAVFNLTAAATGGAGFLAAFPANITWPGNSSVNFNSGGIAVANLVICGMDSAGRVTIRAGATSSDFIIDRIGSLI